MNSLIKDTLTPLGYPVGYLTYTGAETTYITFSYWETPVAHADNKEVRTSFTVQIDVLSQGNLLTLTKNVKNNMITAGFMKTYEDGEYIDEIKSFRKILRFHYTKASE